VTVCGNAITQQKLTREYIRERKERVCNHTRCHAWPGSCWN